jgi:hypothetical protein
MSFHSALIIYIAYQYKCCAPDFPRAIVTHSCSQNFASAQNSRSTSAIPAPFVRSRQ